MTSSHLFLKPRQAPRVAFTRFNYTGAVQFLTIPSGMTKMRVKIWSGGGGTNTIGPFRGGSSAFVAGDLIVVPYEQLAVYVGGAGVDIATSPNGAGGGGASAILRASTVLAIAGAGVGGNWNGSYANCGRLASSSYITANANGQDGWAYAGVYPALGGWGYGVGGRSSGGGIAGVGGCGAGFRGGALQSNAINVPGFGGTSDWSGLANTVTEAGAPNVPGGSSDTDKQSTIGNWSQNGQIVFYGI